MLDRQRSLQQAQAGGEFGAAVVEPHQSCQQTRLAVLKLAQAVGQPRHARGSLCGTGREAPGPCVVRQARHQLTDGRGLTQQALGETVRPVDKALRAVGQPTLRATSSAQPAFELIGAGLQRIGTLRDALVDEQQLAACELERNGAVTQRCATCLQLLQPGPELSMAALQRTAALAQCLHIALRRRARVDQAQSIAELAQPVAELPGAIGELRRGALQVLADIACTGEPGNQCMAALAGLVCRRSGRSSAFDEPVDTRAQRSQVTLGAGRRVERKRPAALVQRFVDTVRQLRCEALGQPGRGVVVALGQVQDQAPGARLGAEHRLSAEVGRQQDGEREAPVAHLAPGVFGVAELAVAEQALALQRLQHLGAEIHVARAVAQPGVLVHQRHRELRRARTRIPDAGQHDQRVQRGHQHRAERGPGQLGVAAHQGCVAGGGETEGRVKPSRARIGHWLRGAAAQKSSLR